MRLAVTISLALALAGCARRPYVRPEIATPAVHKGTTTETQQVQLNWRDLVPDEELAKLIREALEHNYDVKIAAARVLEARAQVGLARSARFPTLDALASYDNSRSIQWEMSSTTLASGLRWDLDVWGQIRSASAAELARALAQEQTRRVVLDTVASDVAGAYFLLCDLDLELDITRQALELRQASLELVRLRTENGYSSEIELRQAEVLVKTARAALTGLELQREQTENQISILLGRNPGRISRGRSLLESEMLHPVPAGLPSKLLDSRPDIRQAEQQLIADHLMVDAARTAYFPAVSLTANGGYASSALMALFNPTNSLWLLSPVVNLPVFHAGAIRNGVRVAEARREESVLSYKKTVQQAFREVADGLAGQQKLAELRIQQQSLVESLSQGVELADLAYKGGVVSYLEYLDAERQLLDSELQLVQIRRQELTNAVLLYRALGGSW